MDYRENLQSIKETYTGTQLVDRLSELCLEVINDMEQLQLGAEAAINDMIASGRE